MKSFILLIFALLFSSSNGLTFEASPIINQIENLNKITSTVNCPTCTDAQGLSHLKTTVLTDINSQKLELTVLSPAEADKLVAQFLNDKNIPFDYALDGCFARAHKMAYLMQEKGIISGKAFVIGRLFANPKYGPVSWRYHVAPVVLVKINDEIKPYIIDPALFNKAVPYEEWRNLITGASSMPGRSRAARVIEYYTNRFIYDPTNAKTTLLEFQPADLADADATLARFQEIKKQLDGRK